MARDYSPKIGRYGESEPIGLEAKVTRQPITPEVVLRALGKVR
jgi:hypothetical protein